MADKAYQDVNKSTGIDLISILAKMRQYEETLRRIRVWSENNEVHEITIMVDEVIKDV